MKFLALIILASILLQAPTRAQDNAQRGKVADWGPALYKEAQAGSEVLVSEMAKNSPVVILGEEGEMLHVEYDGMKGYVMKSGIVFLQTDAQRASFEERLREAARADSLRLAGRDSAQTKFDRLKREAEELLREGKQFLIWRLAVRVNSAGGAEPIIEWENLEKERIIKYVTFTAVPYNAVGDVQSSSIGGKRTALLEITGPIDPGDIEQLSAWEPVWYNSTISCFEITRMDVEFMNGAHSIFVNDLPGIMADGRTNSCSFEAQRARQQYK